MAYSEEDLKELCLENTEGVLFEYDVEQKEGHMDTLLNERLYKGKLKLAKKVKTKKKTEEDNDEIMLNSEIGDLR